MRIGVAPAGLLVERLVVPEPHGLDTEQLGRRPSERLVEGERADLREVLPEVHALQERLLVPALLLERDGVARGPVPHGLRDERAVVIELVNREQPGDDDVALLPKLLHELGRHQPLALDQRHHR